MAEQKKNGIIQELKEFIFRGNVMDMAVGVIIGAAFKDIITSLVDDIFMPVISLLTGKIDFSNLFIALDGTHYPTLSLAQEAGAATLRYGIFITKVIDFFLVAVCIFFAIKTVNRLMAVAKREEAPAAEEKSPRLCPFCRQPVADEASRCPHCTSDISQGAGPAA